MAGEDKPLVLIVGATGNTGSSIVKELLAAGTFRVAAIVRPTSLEKPETLKQKAAGVDIRSGDISNDSEEKLTSLLQGVDVLIAVVLVFVDQRPILRAAKNAGVKRVVPSEFGPPAPPGAFFMIDDKYAIRQFITELGLGYTFIQVGWWLNFMWPYPHGLDLSSMEQSVNVFYGEGDKPLACTHLPNIGKFVARIIADPRTLNQVVMTWDVELTPKESWTLAEKISGEDFSDNPRMSLEEVQSKLNDGDPQSKFLYGYPNVLYVHGYNTVANAKQWGALDARELYPDYEPTTVEEAARDFYNNPYRLNYNL